MSLKGHPPEKDGILACLLAAEVAAVEGAALGDVLERLYGEVGRLLSVRINVPLSPSGARGASRADRGAAGGARTVAGPARPDDRRPEAPPGRRRLGARAGVRHRAGGAALRGGARREHAGGDARRRDAALLRMSPPGAARRARVRLDELLVTRGLADTRAEAARLILGGQVRLPGGVAAQGGPARRRPTPLWSASRPRPSSGGAERSSRPRSTPSGCRSRAACAWTWGPRPAGSPTACSRGARAASTPWTWGTGSSIRASGADPRVVVWEGVNARHLAPDRFPERPTLATVDVSFISLEKVLPAVAACLAAPAEIVALVKPQFEVGRGEVGKGGVVRAWEARRAAVRGVAAAAAAIGLARGRRGGVRAPRPEGQPGGLPAPSPRPRLACLRSRATASRRPWPPRSRPRRSRLPSAAAGGRERPVSDARVEEGRGGMRRIGVVARRDRAGGAGGRARTGPVADRPRAGGRRRHRHRRPRSGFPAWRWCRPPSCPARSTSSSCSAATARSCRSRAWSTAWTCPSSASTWAASAS